MEKQENKTAEPLQGRLNDVKGALARALGVENEQTHQSSDVVKRRIWKFPAQRKIAYKHRKLFKSGVVPNPSELSHLPHGFKNGCICEKCMVEHGWFDFEESNPADSVPVGAAVVEKVSVEEKRVSDVEDVKAAIAADEDDMIVELMDEELAGIILDSFREAGSLLYKGKGYPDAIGKIWEGDKREVAVLGRAGKKVWDKYARLPNFKYKEILVLSFLVGKSIGLRVWATSQIINAKK